MICPLRLTSVGHRRLRPFLDFGGERFLQPQVVLPRVEDAARQSRPEVAGVAEWSGMDSTCRLNVVSEVAKMQGAYHRNNK